jgi:predicted amidohydrolase
VGRRREPRRPELAASYRKVFPWRPYERWGGSFVVADMAGFGRVGLSICYDSWFPEVARHLAWMGAEVILNPTLTPTADRAQELVLARAQAITNQVYVVGVNAAAPTARGRSGRADPWPGRIRRTGLVPGPSRSSVVTVKSMRRIGLRR